MPHIIPIKDLKDTASISRMCKESDDPVYITKNGYGDMVIMSMKAYEERMLMQDVYAKLVEAEEAIQAGEVEDARRSLARLREKYHV